MATREEELCIDDYFCKRLMSLESAISGLGGIEIYSNSIPAGSVGGECSRWMPRATTLSRQRLH